MRSIYSPQRRGNVYWREIRWKMIHKFSPHLKRWSSERKKKTVKRAQRLESTHTAKNVAQVAKSKFVIRIFMCMKTNTESLRHNVHDENLLWKKYNIYRCLLSFVCASSIVFTFSTAPFRTQKCIVWVLCVRAVRELLSTS